MRIRERTSSALSATGRFLLRVTKLVVLAIVGVTALVSAILALDAALLGNVKRPQKR